MRYYKRFDNGYINSIGTGLGGVEITEDEFNHIKAIIDNRPTAQSGYGYRLTAELEWELYELPIVEEVTEEA